MGQIFNRIKDIAKAYSNDTLDDIEARRITSDKDEELKKIIDDLKNDNSYKNDQSNNKFNQNSSNFNQSNNTNDKNSEPNSSGEKLDMAKACSILGIPMNAKNDEIKSAYKTKIMEYHPDKVAAMGDEIKTLALQKTKEINEAYNLLKKIKNL